MTSFFRLGGPASDPPPKERSYPVRSVYAVLGLVLLLGCSRSQPATPALIIEHEIAPQPLRVGPATVTLNLRDASANNVVGARVALEADMSHAGMAPVFAEAKEVAPGRYQTSLAFGMAGDWVILVRVALPDGQSQEQQFDVRGVKPN